MEYARFYVCVLLFLKSLYIFRFTFFFYFFLVWSLEIVARAARLGQESSH